MGEPRTRILIVDDRRDQLLTLQAVVADLVDDVICASTGREALRILLDANEFAVMLLDIQMPGMDGLELAELVRQHKVHRNTPLIFVTASGDDLYVERCYALGAVDYILAPVVASVLRSKINVLVELHKKTQQVRRQAEVLRRRATQLHSLTSASLGIHSAGSVPEVLRAVAEAAQSIVGAECVVARVATAGHQAPLHTTVVRMGARFSSDAAAVASLERLETFVRDRATSLRLARGELARADEWQPTLIGQVPPIESYVGAPLHWSDGQPLGVLQVSGRVDGGDFDPDDEAVIAQLAHIAAIAIQNRILGDAREANRLKDEFFTNLSHELRNPLNAVAGWIQLLQRLPLEAPGRDRALVSLARNAELLTRLVDDLLDASRIGSKRMAIAMRPLALDQVVQATVDALRVTADAKGLALACEVLDPPVDVVGDEQRLTQVLWNLVANAIKFTPKGGHVTVRLGRDGPEAVLVVHDDGEGIAPDFLPHVFERFRQARSSSQGGFAGGLGLGLAIARGVIELHGGTVAAASAGPGKGAQFTVRMPLHQPAMELEGYHVLLIEGDPGARSTLERAFSGLGARVTAVAEPAHALSALGASKPHLVVAPTADLAADSVRALKSAIDPARELPVLALDDGAVGQAWHAAAVQRLQPRIAELGALARAIRSRVAVVRTPPTA